MFKNGTPSRPGGATTRNAPPETAWIRNIRAYLRRRGNSATALSRRAGLKSTYVRDILNGRSRGPRTDKLLQLARAMDTTLDALLGDPAFANARGVPLLWSVATRAGESAPDV